MNTKVKSVIIIPTYNEMLALPSFILELSKLIDSSCSIIVMDDSPRENFLKTQESCMNILGDIKLEIYFENSGAKSGRGLAVRRGMKLALQLFPNLKNILECDADGSHRPQDIFYLINLDSKADLVVGSRYLKKSKIIGWGFTRRLFSQILNLALPRIFSIPVRDITNGLRRYSLPAAEMLLRNEQHSYGFTYLTEQAFLISKNHLKISEVPTVFINRTLGKSTVTVSEIKKSFIGIIEILKNRHKL